MGKTYGERWEIVDALGEGGQAHTFLVKDLRGDNQAQYVLKRLKNINRIDRFKREIEAVRNLSHPNIVQLIDYDLDAEKPYLVTEYCAGGALSSSASILKQPIVAHAVFDDICQGVAHAHAKGVTHRDLKPENIFLRTHSGPAVVGDFGICYIDESEGRVTITEEAVGPRLFMAPELEDGRADNITPKSDIYSLGKILYWLLSGGRMFSREKHRLSEYDLKGKNLDTQLGWNNIYMEHVNRILDVMITHEPEARQDLSVIMAMLKRMKHLLRNEYSPLGEGLPQPCTYCGYGVYKLVASGVNVRNFGFTPVGNPNWKVLVCSDCGHVQAFRVDFASRQEWWSST